jgi:hypothetical protein
VLAQERHDFHQRLATRNRYENFMLDIFEPVFEIPATCFPAAHRSAPLQADTKDLGASHFFILSALEGESFRRLSRDAAAFVPHQALPKL